MKFETVRIHFQFRFGLLSFRNFAPKTTWRNDFSSLLFTLNISEAPTLTFQDIPTSWDLHLMKEL